MALAWLWELSRFLVVGWQLILLLLQYLKLYVVFSSYSTAHNNNKRDDFIGIRKKPPTAVHKVTYLLNAPVWHSLPNLTVPSASQSLTHLPIRHSSPYPGIPNDPPRCYEWMTPRGGVARELIECFARFSTCDAFRYMTLVVLLAWELASICTWARVEKYSLASSSNSIEVNGNSGEMV